MQWGDAGLGDQGSLLGGGEIGRGVQRLGWEGTVFPQELEDSHYGWSKVEKGGGVMLLGSWKSQRVKTAMRGLEFSSSWEQ